MNPLFHTDFSISDSLKNFRKSVLIYETIIEYPHGDITNIIYCMVHRLKQKLKKVDVNAEHIISSVKEVGYCLKVYKES